MDLNDIIIREYREEDAPAILDMYLEEYGSYPELNSTEKINAMLRNKNCLTQLIEYENKVISTSAVLYEEEHKRGYLFGLVMKKEYRRNQIFQTKVSNIDHAVEVLKLILNRFKEAEIFYAIIRGSSSAPSLLCDLTGYKVNGLWPFAYIIRDEREPYIIRISYPETEKVTRGLYNKKILHLWHPPEVISEAKKFTDTVIKFCNLEGESIIKDAKLGISNAAVRSEVYDHSLKVSTGDDYTLVDLEPLNKSAKIKFNVNETGNLKPLIKSSLDNLKDYEFIRADAHEVNEQRALYDLGFRQVSYMPLFDIKDNKRIDTFTFVKLQGIYDFKGQKEKLLSKQRSYKIKKLSDFVYSNAWESKEEL